jgi:hypothetical protein
MDCVCVSVCVCVCVCVCVYARARVFLTLFVCFRGKEFKEVFVLLVKFLQILPINMQVFLVKEEIDCLK